MYQSNASVMTERPLLLLVILVPSWTTGLSNQWWPLKSKKLKLSLPRLLKLLNTTMTMLRPSPLLPMSTLEKLMPLLQVAKFATGNAHRILRWLSPEKLKNRRLWLPKSIPSKRKSIRTRRLSLKTRSKKLRLLAFCLRNLRTQLRRRDTLRAAPTSKLKLLSSLLKLRLRELPSRKTKEERKLLLLRKLRKFLDKNKRRPSLPPRLPRSTRLSLRSKRLLVSLRKPRRESHLSKIKSRLREFSNQRSPSRLLSSSLK
jgi:hypothetical protein